MASNKAKCTIEITNTICKLFEVCNYVHFSGEVLTGNYLLYFLTFPLKYSQEFIFKLLNSEYHDRDKIHFEIAVTRHYYSQANPKTFLKVSSEN